jgi:hypothetical protein
MWSEVASFSLLCLTSVFFIVNPFSGTTLFITLTDGYSPQAKRKAARRAVLVAGAVLLVFAITGNLVFRLFGVTLGAFRVAGGILLLRVAMDMLHGRASDTKTSAPDIPPAAPKEDLGVAPQAVGQGQRVQPVRGDRVLASGIDLQGSRRLAGTVVGTVPQELQRSIFRLGGFDDQEGNAVRCQLQQQVQHGRRLAGAGGAADEHVLAQLPKLDAAIVPTHRIAVGQRVVLAQDQTAGRDKGGRIGGGPEAAQGCARCRRQ